MAETTAPEKASRVKDLMRTLQAEKDKILAIVDPARADYERLINDPRLIECRQIIKQYKPKLFELDNELAALARALPANKGIAVEPGVYSAQG